MSRKFSFIIVSITAAFIVALASTEASAGFSRQVPQGGSYNLVSAATGHWVNVTKFPSKLGSLTNIAQTEYGNANLWKVIYDANRTRIKNPNVLYIGQRVYIPVLKASRSATRVTKPKVSTPVPPAVNTNSWRNPLSGAKLTSCFGWRGNAMHQGIDMAKPTGTPIRAAHAGNIRNAGWNWDGYGISVAIANGGSIWTHYAHMSREIVSVGQHVVAGQIIGYVGATGDATGPHLHFEVHSGSFWNQINPAPFLRNHGVKVGC